VAAMLGSAVIASPPEKPRDFADALVSLATNLPEKCQRVEIGGVPIDRMTMAESVQWVIERLRRRTVGSPLMIMGPNAHLVTLAKKSTKFRDALASAHLNVPDGISIVLASRLLGTPIPERVPGGELMERLCEECGRFDLSVFFLGGLPGAAAGAAEQLRRRYPSLRVAGCYCPAPGFENNPIELAAIRQLIVEAKPKLLCVAFGAPKQEIWMHDNCPALPIGAAISVGAALDTCAGFRKRAPRWTHRIGMEWLYRLTREPRRLWRRYLIGNLQFLILVGGQLAHQVLISPAKILSSIYGYSSRSKYRTGDNQTGKSHESFSSLEGGNHDRS
jgi:N-acetylglucosaminyldiphosphoundecaprenol N-acetyl-beta-D-mannosaminyltransferase